jgi:hypothetical protein
MTFLLSLMSSTEFELKYTSEKVYMFVKRGEYRLLLGNQATKIFYILIYIYTL